MTVNSFLCAGNRITPQKNFFARASPLTHHAFGNNAKQSASPEGLCPPQANQIKRLKDFRLQI